MKPSDLIIRPYKDEDFPRLCEIHDAARMDELAHCSLEDAFIPLETAAENEGLFDYTVSVLEQGDKVEGFVAHCLDEIAWLYVDPGAYRSGIGSQLLEHAVKQCDDDAEIEVIAANKPALSFYQSHGFEIIGTDTGEMVGNEAFVIEVHTLKRAA